MWIQILAAGLALLAGYLIWLRLRDGSSAKVSGAAGTSTDQPKKAVDTTSDITDGETEEGVIYELTAEDVPNIIQKEAHVVIMVYAPWCGFCKKMEPEFAKAAQKLQGHCTWARLNAQEFGETAQALGVESYPTTLEFKNGQLVKPLPGAMDAETLAIQVQ